MYCRRGGCISLTTPDRAGRIGCRLNQVFSCGKSRYYRIFQFGGSDSLPEAMSLDAGLRYLAIGEERLVAVCAEMKAKMLEDVNRDRRRGYVRR